VRTRLRVTDRGEHPLLERGRHRVLEPLGLLVDLVPWHAQHVGEEALDQAVAHHDLLGPLATLPGEGERLVLLARDEAVLAQAAHHLVDGRRGDLHRAGDVRARDGQLGLHEPVDALQVFLFGDGCHGKYHCKRSGWRAFGGGRSDVPNRLEAWPFP
jgi:hypothetical protein